MNLLIERELRKPLFALTFACTISGFALLARLVSARQWHDLYLAWNLFLALLPLVFALALRRALTSGSHPRLAIGLSALWLLFLPNAPYILTDFVHLKSRIHPHYWTDLMMLLLFAWCGAFAGFLSLLIVQRLAAVKYGLWASWLLVLMVAALAGVGIHLGRFERWNSWDILIHPWAIFCDVIALLKQAFTHGRGFRVAVLFGLVILMGHTMLYSLLPIRSPDEDK